MNKNLFVLLLLFSVYLGLAIGNLILYLELLSSDKKESTLKQSKSVLYKSYILLFLSPIIHLFVFFNLLLFHGKWKDIIFLWGIIKSYQFYIYTLGNIKPESLTVKGLYTYAKKYILSYYRVSKVEVLKNEYLSFLIKYKDKILFFRDDTLGVFYIPILNNTYEKSNMELIKSEILDKYTIKLCCMDDIIPLTEMSISSEEVKPDTVLYGVDVKDKSFDSYITGVRFKWVSIKEIKDLIQMSHLFDYDTRSLLVLESYIKSYRY